jgi:hypothetical protein
MNKEESEYSEDSEDEGMFVECEVVHDSISITHFLPAFMCKNCDD